MDESLLESLLYQSESATLDFKAQQYPFSKGTLEQKGEILKDIIAFANAWRQSDAYILIGVQEVKGGPGLVVGISPADQLDDHSLQQFVCSKTNRPIPFSYAPFHVGDRQIGVITIHTPDQRPFYLNDSFGRVEKHAVYIRRGSSTAVASPDEVGRMAANTAVPVGQPVLTLQLCNAETRLKYGTSMEVRPATVELPDSDEFPCYGKPQYANAFGAALATGSFDNNDYYADVAEYIKKRFKLCPIGVAVTNSATTSADAVLVTLEVSSLSPAELAGEDDLPTPPSRSAMNMNAFPSRYAKQVSVAHYDATQEVRISMGEIHAGRTEYCKESFYVTGDESATVSMKVAVSAKNLRIPVTTHVEISIVPTTIKLSVAEVVQFAESRR
jgi:hypothetical protein